ncbi:hypothetical protein AK812_SmicGene25220 [Symbiodinium microadriaticum]|uniref:Uncharacterized protein n=1 Tax=Symbiodinium microadriaticum TaxID=2951 RepID=A0A1Q9DCF8_SYMMI|nr:hypothetical protein AK812_SmicGene25220 [Symbiodinium microadriaticum]
MESVKTQKGFVRQDLTGRCLGPTSCEEEAELQAQECEFFLPGTMQRWEVNTCAGPSGETPVSWVQRSMILMYENTEQRFVFHEQGQIQSQWSSMCLEPRLQCRKPMDTDGDLGYGDGTVVWKACEMQMVSPALHPCLEQASCWKRNYKWEPLSMPGTGQESEPTAADCQQRRSVFRSVFLTFSSKALQVRSRMHPLLVVDQRSLLPSGSAVLTYETWVLFRMISDQLWKFVEADVAKVTLNDCRTQDPSTDQYFELTASGLLKNWPNASNHDPGLYETGEPAAGGRCLMVIEPEDTEVRLAECDETNVLQTFEWLDGSRVCAGQKVVVLVPGPGLVLVLVLVLMYQCGKTVKDLQRKYSDPTDRSFCCEEGACVISAVVEGKWRRVLAENIHDGWDRDSRVQDKSEVSHAQGVTLTYRL